MTASVEISRENIFLRLWRRINEPRFVSIVSFVFYVVAFFVASYSFVHPPGSLVGELGEVTMRTLLALLTLGSGIGAIAVLPGWNYLEKIGIAANSLAMILYMFIVLTLHFTTPGNRLLQSLVIFGLLVHACAVRWYRIKSRPYRPERDKD